MKQYYINDLLEEWQVHAPGMFENDFSDKNPTWSAVSNNQGIIAYFSNEKDANDYRIMKIINSL